MARVLLGSWTCPPSQAFQAAGSSIHSRFWNFRLAVFVLLGPTGPSFLHLLILKRSSSKLLGASCWVRYLLRFLKLPFGSFCSTRPNLPHLLKPLQPSDSPFCPPSQAFQAGPTLLYLLRRSSSKLSQVFIYIFFNIFMVSKLPFGNFRSTRPNWPRLLRPLLSPLLLLFVHLLKLLGPARASFLHLLKPAKLLGQVSCYGALCVVLAFIALSLTAAYSKTKSKPPSLNGQIECQKECQKICQIKCQNVCQIECQKICQIECQKVCQIECQIECQKVCQIKCQNVCQIERQKICQIECQIECQKICQIKCQKKCQKVCQIECQIECQKVCQIKYQNVCQIERQKICQIECQVECQKRCQKICQIECQKICQNICRVECQKICQIECQKICQIKCQKICQIECQKICQ